MPTGEGQPQLSGFINMNKPVGYTSFDVIARLRRMLHIRKLGHSGVLDKPATGVLPVGVNRATRLFQYFDHMLKVYLTSFLFGFSTDTDDITGRIIAVGGKGAAEHLKRSDLEAALLQFRGRISQVPPRFSTTKVHGKEFYRLALRGQEVPRLLKRVTVEGIEILDFKDGPEVETLLAEYPQLLIPRNGARSPAAAAETRELPAPPVAREEIPPVKLMTIRIFCREGFYVRSLARDLGEIVGARGCVFNLVREQVGPFRVAEAVGFDEIQQALDEGNFRERILHPMRAIAEPERTVRLDAPSVARLRDGQQVLLEMRFLPEALRKHGQLVFVLDPEDRMVAVARTLPPVPGDRIPLQPSRMLH